MSVRTAALAQRALGKTGLSVSLPALGGAGLGSTAACNIYGAITDTEAVKTVHHAFDRGITYIDTSPAYGRSESRIGLALKARPEIRDSVVLQTKCGTHPVYPGYTADAVMKSVESSLLDLDVEHIDVLLLHDPTPKDLAVALAPDGALEAMRWLKAAGLVTNVGIGVREHDVLLKFIRTGACDVILTYLDWNLMNRSAGGELFKECAARGVGVANGGVLYNGLLSGVSIEDKMNEGGRETPEALRQGSPLAGMAAEIDAWCTAREIPTVAMALHFGNSHAAVSSSVVGCRTVEEIDGIVDAMEHHIDEATWEEFGETFDDRIAGLEHWAYEKKEVLEVKLRGRGS
jgi:aryl-alcohol dehydrogenase-like predicted oxidoreductase